MDNQFFIIESGQQAGPFSREMLAARNITPDTLVWRQGLAEWTPAGRLPELQSMFVNPYAQQSAYNPQYAPGMNVPSPQSLRTNWLTWAIVATVVGALFSCIGMVFGIIGITKANQANRFYEMGDNYNGDVSNNSARTNTIIAFVLAGIGLIASIAMFGSSGVFNYL